MTKPGLLDHAGRIHRVATELFLHEPGVHLTLYPQRQH